MTASAEIVLVSGPVKARDAVGHHDYLAGCRLTAFLLEQTAGVRVTTAEDGWPADDGIFANARAVVFYTGGGDSHAFLGSAPRLERMQRLIDNGVGVVMLHRAVRYPPAFAGRAASWLGGAHVSGVSGRGHWPTHHRSFPIHPVTRGVRPWETRDGWLNVRLVDGMRGVTPLVWSGRTHRGSNAGGAGDVVGWTYDRPAGGRSFCFTGLDAHAAWSIPGVRQLVVNGILWSAGVPIPEGGAPCAVSETKAQSYLTPRQPKAAGGLGRFWRRLKRLAG